MPASQTNTVPAMTGDQFCADLVELGFASSSADNDLGLSGFARFIGRSSRTCRAWRAAGPPGEIAVLLRLMRAAKIDAADAQKLLRGRRR